MKKTTLLYIPLLLLFAFSATVLTLHYGNLIANARTAQIAVVLPFTTDGTIQAVKPDAEAAGLKIGDKIRAVNGEAINDDATYKRIVNSLRPGEPMNLTVERKTAEGTAETHQIALTLKPLVKDFNYYGRMVVGFLFAYLLPTISILLGFWVVLVRPRDPLAWLLLFLMIGFSSITFENYPANSILRLYSNFGFSVWGAAMMLFGIYFPERWELDRRFPWAKWILLVPLAVICFLMNLGQLKTFAGIGLIDYFMFVIKPINQLILPVNMLAISIFFVALGWKSGTLTNPDARRRLKLIVIGTMTAMMPSFLIILYRIVSGGRGSFFDLVPAWLAILALLLMPLFPLTLAYVIVVHRAMDVSVVIRQGLQYALAQNGVRVLQMVLSVCLIVSVVWIFQNFEGTAERIGFVAAAFAVIPLIDALAKRLRVWVDKKFFREAYNAEQILSDLSEEVRTMVETKPLLETVSHKIAESLHVPQVTLLLRNGSGFQPAYALGYDAMPAVTVSENARLVEKLKKNEPVIIYTDDPESWINEQNLDDERQVVQTLNSQLLLPVGVKEKLSGFISLSPKRAEAPYTPNDLRLLRSVAAQTGLALENSRLTEAFALEAAQRERLNREVEIAREVQERLFPQELPKIEGLDYAGACRPALGVGGDYYDFLALPEGRFGIAIGDVSGKGIAASLLMASLQASLRGQAIQGTDDLATLMSHVNKLVYDASTSNRYATFFYSQYDSKNRKLFYVNAGHNPPVVLRRNGTDFEILRLEDGGAVVGMLPPEFIFYKQGEIELQSGDLLIGFTDGISEAMNPEDEEWGEDKMIEAAINVFEMPASDLLKHLVAKADEFANGAKQHDDMTLIIVRVI